MKKKRVDRQSPSNKRQFQNGETEKKKKKETIHFTSKTKAYKHDIRWNPGLGEGMPGEQSHVPGVGM